MTKIIVTIEMQMTENDFANLQYNMVEAYRKFSEITKGNIISGKIEEE